MNDFLHINALNSLDDIIHIVNRNMECVLCNKAFEDALKKHKLADSPVIGRNLYDLCPFLSDRVRHEFDQVWASGTPLITQERNVLNQQVYWTETHKKPLRDEKGNVSWIITIIRDITKINKSLHLEIKKHKQTEKTLKQSREQLKAQYDAIPVPTYTWQYIDGHFKLTRYNKAAEEITEGKISNFLGITADKMYADLPEIQEEMRICLSKQKPVQRKMSYRLKSTGKKKYFSVQYAYVPPDSVLVHTEDITKTRKIEHELQQARKLESIGVLAGGIAHDFNNCLMGIMGFISLAKKNIQNEQSASEILIKAEKATVQAKDLTNQILTFSKGGDPILKPTLIRASVIESVELATKGSKITCNFNVPETTWPVEIDENQIRQVFHNLAVNSVQATVGCGTITIRVENVHLKAQGTASLKKGKYIKILFQDTGEGISSENQKMVFDPFFSTKPDGSGLGLSICYSIIRKHNGFLSFESESGAGTTFTVYLPATDKQVLPRTGSDEDILQGSGKILIMDDEEMVRDVLVMMLEDYGFDVIHTPEGSEAFDLYRQAMVTGNPFDVVILDLTVPGGDGGQKTIKKLLDIDPQVKAIVSSGYANSAILSNYKRYGFSDYIVKPYKASKLIKKLHALINTSPH